MRLKLLGTLTGLCALVVLLFTIAQAVVYTPAYFEREYTKYGVPESIGIRLPDLMDVTEEMMDYLKGDREDLVVVTEINGETREFFNDREKAHMADVKHLVLGAFALRRWAFFAGVLLTVFMVLRKGPWKEALCWGFRAACGVFFGVGAALFALVATDFTKYFRLFHHLFFTNDLWILDPATDLLINIVPEPFFIDTAALIMGCFLAGTLVLFVGATLYLKHRSRS